MALIPPITVQQHYGIPTTRLAQWRRQVVGPEYFAFGQRSMPYYPADIDAWLTHQNQHPNRHAGTAGTHVAQAVLAGNNAGNNATVGWNG